MMSRSLGPEFGIPIGISLLISNIGLCVMYVIGFVEYIVDNFRCCVSDCDIGDVRYFSAAAFFLTLLLAIASIILPSCSMFLSKVTFFLLAFILHQRCSRFFFAHLKYVSDSNSFVYSACRCNSVFRFEFVYRIRLTSSEDYGF